MLNFCEFSTCHEDDSCYVRIAMKLHTLIIATAVTASVCAGQTTSAPANTLGDWFAGTSFGQFVNTDTSGGDVDLNLYTLHLGRNLDQQLLGCDLASYFEVGYLDVNGQDGRIVPFTLNISAERELCCGVKGYATGGIGYAFTTVDADPGSNGSGGFYAQTSLGLSYDVNESWEIYGGARYLFLDNVEYGTELSVDNNVGYELGLRYNF